MMKHAFIFPGQGSQSIGMLSELAEQFTRVKETVDEASEVLGWDLWRLIQQGPEDQLNSTDKTQPAMLAAGVAIWRVWIDQTERRPQLMAGHSLGEYTALVCAGALKFTDAIALVADRGRFMQAAVPQGSGAMAAIMGLADDKVQALCAAQAEDQVLQAVNYNSPGQVVIAGHREAVERAVANASSAGAKRAVLLSVSVPSHCALMQSAAMNLQQRLQAIEIKNPTIPVVHNCDVAIHEEAAAIKNALVKQLDHPVLWVKTIQWMDSQGVTQFIECGPGKILTGLNKRIIKKASVYPMHDAESLQKALHGNAN